MASNKKTLLSIAFCVVVSVASAQTQFITKGRVEYERKINQHKPYEERTEDIWFKELMKIYPKFTTDVFELRFDDKRSVYKVAKENTSDVKYLNDFSKPNGTDMVIQDLQLRTVSTQREVFENTYIIKDSLRNLDWRITDETRTIAGFDCRKAVSKICDSVYVVAFYTDQIAVSSGPESFGGLPGMILELAIPRLYTTWIANKVELVEPTTAQLNPSQKGKKVKWVELNGELKPLTKRWGKDAERMVWMIAL